jgi:hypothetical protein
MRIPMNEDRHYREFYEARPAGGDFLTCNVEVAMPDSSTAILTSRRLVRYPGVISTANVTYAVDRSRMSCGDRDVVRYVDGGIYKRMRSIHFSDVECGREYFLCWRPSGDWFGTTLVLMENDIDVGRYHLNVGKREDGLYGHARGDTLVLIPGISMPLALLILWIGTLADFFSEE